MCLWTVLELGFLWGYVFNKIYHQYVCIRERFWVPFRVGFLIYEKMVFVHCLFSLYLKRGVEAGQDMEIVLAEE